MALEENSASYLLDGLKRWREAQAQGIEQGIQQGIKVQKMLKKGKSTKEIADALGISEETVEKIAALLKEELLV